MIWLPVNRDFLISVGPVLWKSFRFSAPRICGAITILPFAVIKRSDPIKSMVDAKVLFTELLSAIYGSSFTNYFLRHSIGQTEARTRLAIFSADLLKENHGSAL